MSHKLFLGIVFIFAASPAHAQSVTQERRAFGVVVTAARALIELEVQAADANGAVRQWDGRW